MCSFFIHPFNRVQWNGMEYNVFLFYFFLFIKKKKKIARSGERTG